MNYRWGLVNVFVMQRKYQFVSAWRPKCNFCTLIIVTRIHMQRFLQYASRKFAINYEKLTLIEIN